MDDLEKVLKNLENNTVKPETFSDKEKAISRTIIMLKKALAEIPENESDCGHNPELICAYFDGSLDDKTKPEIEEQLFACDNCFKLYSFLQNQVEEIKNISPEWLKDNVREKEGPKSLFSVILSKMKNNLPLQASGIAVAAMAGFFLLVSPLNEKRSTNMDIASAPQVESKAVEAGEQSREREETSVTQPADSAKKETLPFITEKPATVQNESGLTSAKQANALDNRKQNTEPAADLLKAKIPAKPKPVTLKQEKTKVLIANALPALKRRETDIAANRDNDNKTGKSMVIAKAQPPEEKTFYKNEEETSNFNDQVAKPAKPLAEPEKQLQLTDKANSAKTEAKADKDSIIIIEPVPGSNDNKPVETIQAAPPQADSNIAAGSVAKEQRAENEKTKLSAKDNAGFSIGPVQIDKPSFAVIYRDQNGNPGEIVAKSNLILPGNYADIKLDLNKAEAGKKVYLQIHEDTNNSGFFDNADLPIIKNNTKIIKTIEIN